jgi:Ku protein
MSRSILNTTLELGLVTVPIKVHPTKSAKEITLDRATPVFTEVDSEQVATGYHAIERVELDAVTRLPRSEQVIYGIFESKPDAKDRATWSDFRPIAPEALEAIAAQTKIESLAIDGFIDAKDVPMERVLGCYYLAPDNGAGKQLRLLHDALAATGKYGILKIAIRDKQHPAVVYAKDGAIYMNLLAWAEDCAEYETAGDPIASAQAADPKMVAMAVQLIESMTATREDLDALSDDLRPKKAALVEAALAGNEIEITASPEKIEDAGDLMAKLEASLAASGPKKAAKKKVAAKA